MEKHSQNPVQHIDTMIGDVEYLIKNKQDFVAFVIISIGIEFLGAFYDPENFSEFGLSERRFKNGIKNLFKGSWYKNNGGFLYKNLRGPLIHQYRTGPDILLTSQCKNSVPVTKHLNKEDEKVILVLEKLFEDFKEAATTFKNICNRENSLKKDKLTLNYTAIYSFANPNFTIDFQDGTPASFDASGTTSVNPITSSKKEKSNR